MRLGIIGLPQSGKTTVFNALTGGNVPPKMSGGRVEVNTAVVNVPDARLERLYEIYTPPSKVAARVTYADIAGMDGSKKGISGELLNHLTQMDGLLLVLRAFESETVAHSSGSVDPTRDLASMQGELIINDMVFVERKLERLVDEKKKGGRNKLEIEKEEAIFQRILAQLEQEKPLKELEFTADEMKLISGFGFLSLKPMLIVLNLGEGQDLGDFTDTAWGAEVIPLQGQLEMELAQLPADEAEMFLEEYGITEPSLNRMIRESYKLLGLISFFTEGEDEVRAWTVREGAMAPEAAGVIHTDLEKGFIRAEVVSFEDLDALGGWSHARDAGKLRVEGKTYVMKDGDVVHIRFNV